MQFQHNIAKTNYYAVSNPKRLQKSEQKAKAKQKTIKTGLSASQTAFHNQP